ncbi:MAG: PqqD family protein [Anaerolineae bacterium]|nr:PqqD family protein [Anaerolineae bacterium]
MATEVFYRVDSSIVIGEVLDGEAIIVNLNTGIYYSLDGAGAAVWTAVQAGATLGELIQLVAARYDGAPAEITAGVTALVEELVAEGLLVASEGAAAAPGPLPAPPAAERPPFVQPILQKYTDMADLLLLDPIHEVDEQGWPHPAPRR